MMHVQIERSPKMADETSREYPLIVDDAPEGWEQPRSAFAEMLDDFCGPDWPSTLPGEPV